MASFTALGLFILLEFINLSAANKDTCELYAAVGQSLTLPLNYNRLENSHVLKWFHNDTIILYREKGKVSIGKPADVSATGSLSLKSLLFSSAGVYEANVLNPNGTLALSWTGRLCMMDKVSKPQLTYRCDFKSSAVNLNCYVDKPQGLVFSWTLDEKTLTSETRQTLSISLAQLKGERDFSCSAANKVSTQKSDTVRPTCKSPSPSPPPLLCFTSKTVLAVVAGGAGLILLLITIIIILCCCYSCKKNQMRLKDKGGLRMLSLSKREPDSISPDYETMHPSKDSPPVSPEPPPRTCYESVSEPETESRPPQLSTAAEGQQPSPVPKPRTKSPQAPNI
ncbi:SLAM family member 6-like [Dicentrarchus labrax]|uniref:SLAM family member 6-like n=1 Tax=Dicentrarchus labrax TaxID=13489 RepID=UPI0021F50F30|nr:SLAM family member 6-like [Dicentrarchus labrax]